MNIHPTAIVNKKALIGQNVSIGPYSVIGANVNIGDDTEIASHVVLDYSIIGKKCKILDGSVIGGRPQLYNIGDIYSFVEIKSQTYIGEYVTIHRSGKEGGKTLVGEKNYIMSYAHIGHDCIIENRTTITSYAGLSGHVEVGEFAVIGGHTGIHQFVKIGRMAMIGGMSRIVKDVPPFVLIEGNPAKVRGLNSVGISRNGVEVSSIWELKKVYRILFRSGFNISDALKKVESIIEKKEEIIHLIKFIKESKRGITK